MHFPLILTSPETLSPATPISLGHPRPSQAPGHLQQQLPSDHLPSEVHTNRLFHLELPPTFRSPNAFHGPSFDLFFSESIQVINTSRRNPAWKQTRLEPPGDATTAFFTQRSQPSTSDLTKVNPAHCRESRWALKCHPRMALLLAPCDHAAAKGTIILPSRLRLKSRPIAEALVYLLCCLNR